MDNLGESDRSSPELPNVGKGKSGDLRSMVGCGTVHSLMTYGR